LRFIASLSTFASLFSYTGFWFIALYGLKWANRKFNVPHTPASIHNMYYCFLGVLQWTAWEVVFVNIYANNKLAHISDAEAFSSWGNIARMVIWSLGVPFWREFHFYFAHRFIHIRVLYKFVHSLHHRNTSPDPFSGLCMHPVEHLYYFSCIAPSLFFYMSPFHFLWNGLHLLLSPAASHSGWEDHWQSDQYHYLHHSKFECNYGTMGVPIDGWFGTFRDKIGESTTYKGAGATSEESAKSAQAGLELFAWPSTEQLWFNVVFLVLCGVMGVAVVGEWKGVPREVMGALLAVGPVVVGLIIQWLSGKDKLSIRWPFQKEAVVGTFGFHIIVSLCFTVLPVYYTITTVMK